ncbi:MAG TPA: signal peptidase II [Patescibacteria group bacterium]|nr:signal peptidase II [Patescibacteria group bacterium]
MYPVLIIAAVIAIDQFSKYLTVTRLMPIGDYNVISGFLEFTYVENFGIAFGMFQNQRWFFVISTCIIALVVLYFIFKMFKKYVFYTICLSLIFGGAIGNLIDRIRLGYVIDFIHFSFFPPVFNIADSAVVVGAIALSIAILFTKEA